MKKHNTIEGFKFRKGEVYMLHTDNPDCPNDSSLWALISESDEDALRIESCSTNLRTFTLWKPLPTEYKYCRRQPAWSCASSSPTTHITKRCSPAANFLRASGTN